MDISGSAEVCKQEGYPGLQVRFLGDSPQAHSAMVAGSRHTEAGMAGAKRSHISILLYLAHVITKPPYTTLLITKPPYTTLYHIIDLTINYSETIFCFIRLTSVMFYRATMPHSSSVRSSFPIYTESDINAKVWIIVHRPAIIIGADGQRCWGLIRQVSDQSTINSMLSTFLLRLCRP